MDPLSESSKQLLVGSPALQNEAPLTAPDLAPTDIKPSQVAKSEPQAQGESLLAAGQCLQESIIAFTALEEAGDSEINCSDNVNMPCEEEAKLEQSQIMEVSALHSTLCEDLERLLETGFMELIESGCSTTREQDEAND